MLTYTLMAAKFVVLFIVVLSIAVCKENSPSSDTQNHKSDTTNNPSPLFLPPHLDSK